MNKTKQSQRKSDTYLRKHHIMKIYLRNCSNVYSLSSSNERQTANYGMKGKKCIIRYSIRFVSSRHTVKRFSEWFLFPKIASLSYLDTVTFPFVFCAFLFRLLFVLVFHHFPSNRFRTMFSMTWQYKSGTYVYCWGR